MRESMWGGGGSVRECVLYACTRASLRRPAHAVQEPTWTPTYQMNKSTIIMPCNGTGPTDPESTKGWA